ncbi:hypothetical protein GCM10027288_25200 [Bordetella tumbae]
MPTDSPATPVWALIAGANTGTTNAAAATNDCTANVIARTAPLETLTQAPAIHGGMTRGN